MFGLNWPELVIISVVALIVIGPEDLPKMFRELGRFTGKLRQMSREFSRAMEQASKDTGVSDIAKDLKNVTSPKSLGLDAVKGTMDKFEKWDPLKNAAKPTATNTIAKPLTPPPMPETPATVAPAASSLTSVAARDAAAKAALPSVEDEMADDLAELADLEALDDLEALAELEALEPAPKPAPAQAPAPAHGPHTQALYDKAALKAKVIAEQTEKLKAIEAGTYVPETPAAVAAPDTVPSPVTDPVTDPVATSPQDAAVPGLTRDLDPAGKPKATGAKKAQPKAEAAPAKAKPATKSAAAKAEADKAEAAPKPKTPRGKTAESKAAESKTAESRTAADGTAAPKPKKTRKTPGEETA